MPMTGRTNELNALENEYMKESSMVVVTGRRGMGKTRLVSEFASGKNSLYFLATPVNEHVLLSELNAAVNRFWTKRTGKQLDRRTRQVRLPL